MAQLSAARKGRREGHALGVLERSATKHAARPRLELIKVVAGVSSGEIPLLAEMHAIANRLGVISRIATRITALFFGPYEQRPRKAKGSQAILHILRTLARQAPQLGVRNSSLVIKGGKDAGNIRLVGLPRESSSMGSFVSQCLSGDALRSDPESQFDAMDLSS